jgi:hypothetical protein
VRRAEAHVTPPGHSDPPLETPTASRAFPAVASHAIGFADPLPPGCPAILLCSAFAGAGPQWVVRTPEKVLWFAFVACVRR